MEHYDGEFYTLRLFSPIEGEIYSLNSTEEGIHLTAYEMENYSSFIRDHMEGVGLLGKRNQKLMTYFNNAKRLHKPVSLSLDLEAYEGRLWSVLQADSQDKLTHEEVQSLAETWGMIAAGGFIREMVVWSACGIGSRENEIKKHFLWDRFWQEERQLFIV